MPQNVIAMRRPVAAAPAANPDAIRVLLADGEWLIRAGLRAILAGDDRLDVVGVAADREATIRHAQRLRPDVVVVDEGLHATARLAAAGTGARILVVTDADTEDAARRALTDGAAGTVPRDTHPRRLVEAVATVAAGGAFLAPQVARRLLEETQGGGRVADPVMRGRFAQLSERELDVVRLVARGYSNADIAGELYLSEGTVKTYVTRTLNKLRLRSRVQVVVAAYDAGLVQPGGKVMAEAR